MFVCLFVCLFVVIVFCLPSQCIRDSSFFWQLFLPFQAVHWLLYLTKGLLCFKVRHQILLWKKWKIIRVILNYKKIQTWVKSHHRWIQAIFKLVLYITPQEGERVILHTKFDVQFHCCFFALFAITHYFFHMSISDLYAQL